MSKLADRIRKTIRPEPAPLGFAAPAARQQSASLLVVARLSAGDAGRAGDAVKKGADGVIIDSPPALVVADAMVLSSQVVGVILVIQSGRSKWSAIRQTLYDFQKARANYLGSIINKVPKSITYTVYEKYQHERESPSWVNHLSLTLNEKYQHVLESSRAAASP